MKIISLGLKKLHLFKLLERRTLSTNHNIIGNQSVVVIIDAKKKKFFNGYDIFTHNGTKNLNESNDFTSKLEEIVLEKLLNQLITMV